MKARSKELKSYTHQVKISIEGFKIERLVNRAMDRGIGLKNLRYISETEIICYVQKYDLQSLKKLAGPLYNVSVISNTGMLYKTKKLLKKPMLLITACLTFVLVISQSFFVKTIEINGYKGIPEVELRECLAESGIEKGSFIPNINWKEAEHHIRDVFPQVVWLQLVYDGQKVFLNISEGELPSAEEFPKGLTDKEQQFYSVPRYYCNIIAKTAGYIEEISTYRGVALVEKGDYVEEGQILILGCVPIKEKYHVEGADTEYLVRSKGEIWAKVPYRMTFEQELYDKEGNVKSKKQIEEKAEQQIRLWRKENLPERAEILNKDLKFSYKENIIEVGVTIEIRQQIGEEQEILIGEKNSDSSGN